MSLTLAGWLASMSDRFARDFADFEVYVFEGTQAELMPHLNAWPRPSNVTICPLDAAQLVQGPKTAKEAAGIVESELRTIGSAPGSLLIAVSGLNVLAWLFPGGLLQPLYRWLRSGNRVAVLIQPPAASRPMPDRARLTDWRSAMKQSIAGGTERTITLGGGES